MYSRESISAHLGSNDFPSGYRDWATHEPESVASAPDRLERCPQCGCRALTARGHKLVLDPRGVVFPEPVPALDCNDCGRLYAVNEIWKRRLELGATPVSRLVATVRPNGPPSGSCAGLVSPDAPRRKDCAPSYAAL